MGRLGVAGRARAAELARDARAQRHPRRRPDDPLRVRRHRRSGAIRQSMTRAQLARFAEADRAVAAAGAPLRVRHAANSSGAMLFPEARFDLVRVGIAIYGNGRWPRRALGARRRRCGWSPRSRSCARSPAGGTGRLRRDVARRARQPRRDPAVSATPTACRGGRAATPRSRSAASACRSSALISMDIAIADVTDVAGRRRSATPSVLLGARERRRDDHRGRVRRVGAGCPSTRSRAACRKRVPRTYVEAA